MQIILYGTGSCRPSPKYEGKPFRSYTGWGIELGSDSLIFDIGEGLLNKMLVDGKDILKNPTHVFISHFHPDHTSDIIPLMQGRVVASQTQEIKPLFLGGPSGLSNFCDDLFKNVKSWYQTKDLAFEFIKPHEVEEGLVCEWGNWKVSSSPINHFDNSVCYKLEADGKTIIYSGDMVYDENISVFGKDADVAVLECAYPDRVSLQGKHLCPEDVGKLAKLGNFKKVILTHMYPICEGREEEMVSTIKSIADIEVVVGYDFLKIEV